MNKWLSKDLNQWRFGLYCQSVLCQLSYQNKSGGDTFSLTSKFTTYIICLLILKTVLKINLVKLGYADVMWNNEKKMYNGNVKTWLHYVIVTTTV